VPLSLAPTVMREKFLRGVVDRHSHLTSLPLELREMVVNRLSPTDVLKLAQTSLGWAPGARRAEQVMWSMPNPSAAVRLAATRPFAASKTHPIVAAGTAGWEAEEGTVAYCARVFLIGKAAALQSDDSFRLLAWVRVNGCPWDEATRQLVTRLALPDGIPRIEYATFVGCKVLERVALPSTLDFIAERSFAFCYKLAEVDFAAATRLTEIGDTAFRKCALTVVSLPDSLTRLGEGD
jgi:hypothetical protein